MAGSDKGSNKRPARKLPRSASALRSKLGLHGFPGERIAADPSGLRAGPSSEGKKPSRASAAKMEEPPEHVLEDRALTDAWYAVDTDLSATSGRTGQVRDYSPSLPPFEVEILPQPGASPSSRAFPAGPSPERIREVLDALNRDLARRRSYRAKPGEEEATGAIADQEPQGKPPLHFEALKDSLRERGRQLRNRYVREEAPSIRTEEIDPLEFAVWLYSLRAFLKAPSWRLYRVAGLADIQTRPHANLEAAIAMLSEDGRRRTTCAKKVDRRRLAKEDGISDERADRISHSDYQTLLRNLRKVSRATAVNWLRDWLIAGVTTGIVPAEWPLTELEERRLDNGVRKTWLHIVNPAQGQESRTLAYRTLDISEYEDETLEAIRRMARNSRRWAIQGKVQQRRSECTQLLNKACAILFPKNAVKFSLFTFRHQFIANMKSLKNPAEVIAMAGETVEHRSKHYAKRRPAWDRSDIKNVPAASGEGIRQVRKYLDLVDGRAPVMRILAARRQRRRRRFASAAPPAVRSPS